MTTGFAQLEASDVSGQPRAVEGRFISLTIADTGLGVDPSIADDVFEPFTTTKAVGQGAGLGLATVYGIVSQAAGITRIESKPGRGTTVSVLLPRAAPIAPDDDAIETGDAGEPGVSGETGDTPPEPAPFAAGGEPVLLVEDDEHVRSGVNAMLTSLGFAVSEATNGVEALAMLEHRPEIGLLVSDVTMPEMGGIELAERARDAVSDIKVLLVSGYAETGLDQRSAVDPLLAKPFTLAQLEAKLIEVVDSAERPSIGGRPISPR